MTDTAKVPRKPEGGKPARRPLVDDDLAAAGLRVEASGEVECVWRYDTLADACRGLLSSAGGRAPRRTRAGRR
jgi:hypothetical protein